MIFLDCGEYLYLICQEDCDWGVFPLRSLKLPKEWFTGLNRFISEDRFRLINKIWYKCGKLGGLEFYNEEKYFYLIANQFYGLEVVMTDNPIDDSGVFDHPKGIKIEFISLGKEKDRLWQKLNKQPVIKWYEYESKYSGTLCVIEKASGKKVAEYRW
ncbi:MAG: hypothetical protein IKG80_03445 [Clostridia bacterium]|nr:hypothetical protein [Clostridia bacterium]